MTDPRIPEARRAVRSLDAQLRHLDSRADIAELRPLAARRHALAQFLEAHHIHVPAAPVNW